MKAYFKSKRQVSPSVYEFVFEAPADFEPSYGMNMMLALDHPDADNGGEMRYMSMASARLGELRIAFRVFGEGSTFKKALMSMSVGEYILAGSLRGSFLHQPDFYEQDSPILIAGGIGIVPFRALLDKAYSESRDLKFDLIYCNRSLDDIPYIDEIKLWQDKWPGMKVHHIISGLEADQEGFTSGRINMDLICKLTGVNVNSNRTIYFCGPDAFTHHVRTGLQEFGYDPAHYGSSSFDDKYSVDD